MGILVVDFLCDDRVEKIKDRQAMAVPPCDARLWEIYGDCQGEFIFFFSLIV